MSTKFNMTRDVNGYNGFGVDPTLDIKGCSLAANVAQNFVVPSNYPWWMLILSYSPGSNIWVSFTTTAAVPTGVMASLTSVLNPAGRRVKAGQTISFITADTTAPWICAELQIINPYQN